MPNHVATILTIVGDDAEIKRFVAAVEKGEDNHFDFDGLFPMPDELRGTTSPVRIQSQEEIDANWAEWRKQKENKEDSGPMGIKSFNEDKPFGLGITREKYNELVSKYGYADWYSWKIANHGTKWGAYDAGEWEINEGFATISYSTAWSPATEFFTTVSKQFPSLVFTMEYADEGGGFVCRTLVSNGKITEEESFDWDSEDGINIRKDVGYYWDDEDCDDEDEDENQSENSDSESSENSIDNSDESDDKTDEKDSI